VQPTVVTDAGMETDLIFHRGIDLPEFAAFPLLDSAPGRQALRDYYAAFAEIAARHQLALSLESPTWRANPDWGARLGYDARRRHRPGGRGRASGLLSRQLRPSSHIAAGLSAEASWLGRIEGVRVNASQPSHAELDESEALDEGDIGSLAREVVGLIDLLPNLRLVGGCCGTDARHVERMWEMLQPG